MVSFSTTGLLLYVALFRLGTIHDCAIGWPVLPYGLDSPQPSSLHREVPMRLIGLGVAMIAWLLAAMLTTPLATEAQSRIPSIGVLMPGPVAQRLHMLEALRQGLREQGYVESQNIILVVRSADGVIERLPALAEELVQIGRAHV